MCTSLIHNGKKTIVGWNLDILDMEYRVTPNEKAVYIEINDKTEGWMPLFGVNRRGDFVAMPTCWPADMRSEPAEGSINIINLDIDLLTEKRTFNETAELVRNTKISSVPGVTFQSQLTNNGDMLFGRNFDWQRCTAMVIRTKPKNGYASVSTSNLDFLGFGDNWLPKGMSNQFMALAALYVPLDGMNEKGLCIADLVIDDGTLTNQKTEKPDLTTTAAIRLILDKAATVDEAIELLNQYDMHSSAGMQHHLSIADASGRAVVVEYIFSKIVIPRIPFSIKSSPLYKFPPPEY